jgi:hypothetical protein
MMEEMAGLLPGYSAHFVFTPAKKPLEDGRLHGLLLAIPRIAVIHDD